MRAVLSTRRVAIAAATLLLGLAAGCGDTSEDAVLDTTPAEDLPATTLAVVAEDHTFELSSTTAAAGRVPVTFRNDGAEPHQLIVARLHDGVTLDDYLTMFRDDEEAAGALVDFAGGINVIDPGATATGYADLEPGAYVVLCFVPTVDGTSHLHEGMTAELTVVDAPAIKAPEPIGEIAMVDFGFALPEGGLAEAGAYRVTNEGQSDHELVLMRIDDGKTFGDVAAYLQSGFQGDRPLAFVGGPGGVEPGADTYVDLDLEPGQYVATCFIGDAATGKRHAELGMVATVTVP